MIVVRTEDHRLLLPIIIIIGKQNRSNYSTNSQTVIFVHFPRVLPFIYSEYRVASGTRFGDRFCARKQRKAFVQTCALFHLVFQFWRISPSTRCICIPAQRMVKTTLPSTALSFPFFQLSFSFSESLVRFSRQVFRYCQRANYSDVKLARTRKQGQTGRVFVPTFSLFSRAESTAEASARCYGQPVYTRICSCFSSETDAIKLRAV